MLKNYVNFDSIRLNRLIGEVLSKRNSSFETIFSLSVRCDINGQRTDHWDNNLMQYFPFLIESAFIIIEYNVLRQKEYSTGNHHVHSIIILTRVPQHLNNIESVG